MMRTANHLRTYNIKESRKWAILERLRYSSETKVIERLYWNFPWTFPTSLFLKNYIKKDSSLFLLKRYDCLANLLCLSWYWPFVTFHRFTIHFAVGNIWYVESSSALNYAQSNLFQNHALLNDVKFLMQTAKIKRISLRKGLRQGCTPTALCKLNILLTETLNSFLRQK